MRSPAIAIVACLICALIVWLTRPLWSELRQLELSPQAAMTATPEPALPVPELPAIPEPAPPVTAQQLPPAPEPDSFDPWRRPLLSPITDADLPSWSASVMARQARRSAMAELADVPVFDEQTAETPVRQQQSQALTVNKQPVLKAQSRAERKQQAAQKRAQAERAKREKLQLQLPPAEKLLPPVPLDLNASNRVDVPNLLDQRPSQRRVEFHGRVLTNEDLGRDPIEPPKNALDEIQGAELGIRIKTQ